MYWWSNTAVPEQEDVRVLVPAGRAYASSYDGTVRVVDIPGPPGSADRTWPARSTHAADHFFDLARSARPWIAAVDGSGRGLAQRAVRQRAGVAWLNETGTPFPDSTLGRGRRSGATCCATAPVALWRAPIRPYHRTPMWMAMAGTTCCPTPPR